MLRRKDSNKILKKVKVVLFATSLSLLNPINVSATSIEDASIEKNNDFGQDDLLKICIAGGIVNILVNFKFLHDFNKYAEEEDIEEIIDLVKLDDREKVR